MIKSNVVRNIGESREPPDIIRAAMNDDVAELLAALREGASVNDIDHRFDMNAIHMACIRQSHNFLFAAIENTDVDVWARDGMMRVAFDHCFANKDTTGMQKLFELMYPDTPSPEGTVIPMPER
ncbi:MAG: hypothetical protein AAFV59_16380 [Pseudomonadota bacterium]